MGASLSAYWPGITEAQRDEQPDFRNDTNAWGNFVANVQDARGAKADLHALGADAILTFTTDGVDDGDVQWVKPADLERAALHVLDHVARRAKETARMVRVYDREANGVDPVEVELVRDLEDIAALARWAASAGADRMTLQVNW